MESKIYELKKELEKLKAKKDWLGIYNKFKAINDITKNKEIWEDSTILNDFAFAAAKLSETTMNLRYNFKTERERNNFLQNQKVYRDDTIFLRERCIELYPNNATYYSNLGYSHYQFLNELRQYGGRKDGNALNEANQALSYFEKAIKLSPTRVNDYYRKGQILSNILPQLLRYNKETRSSSEKRKEASKKAALSIKTGILAFKKAIDCYESIKNEANKKGFYKNYIKSLYNLAGVYCDLISNNWDESRFALRFNNNIIANNENIKYIPEDLKNINNAISCLKKCIECDKKGIEEKVNKLYSAGKYYFTKGWILSSYDQQQNEESKKCFDTSSKFYLKALESPWSNEKAKQNKIFIAEKLARLYILQDKNKEAIALLKKYINERKKTDYYVFHTLSLAYSNSNEFEEARKCVDSAINDKYGNKELWLSYFLKACNSLKSENTEEAKKVLEIAKRIAKDNGKENLDSLLIAQGFISYKEGKISEALKFFEKAQILNPHRLLTRNMIRKLKNL